MRTTTSFNRVLLLILTALAVGMIVLSASFTLLPAPPGPPTPTAPYVLDRPEGKPRILH